MSARVVLVHSKVNDGELLSLYETLRSMADTIIAPTFNYDFCQGEPYNHDRTPSQVGLFGEFLRRRGLRSFHPIYSFALEGPRAQELGGSVSRSSFGRGSLFARLYQEDALLVFAGVGFEACTYVHHVEQQLNVPYRFPKYFTGRVTKDGQSWLDTFEMFVRFLDWREVHHNLYRAGEYLEGKGVLVNRAGLLSGRCRVIYDYLADALVHNERFLLDD